MSRDEMKDRLSTMEAAGEPLPGIWMASKAVKLQQDIEASRGRPRTELEKRVIAAMADNGTLPTYADMGRAAIAAARLYIEAGGSWDSSPRERDGVDG